jgi:hypothetical protein
MPTRLEKSKGQLKEGVEKREHKLTDREKHMERVVKERKGLAKVSRDLRYPTKEGAAEIKKALAQSAKATTEEFKRQNDDLKKIHEKCKEAEADLKDRTQMAMDNAKEAKKAEGQIKETKNARPHLAQAEQVSKKDAAFTKEYEGIQRKRRERSIKRRDELNTQLMNTTLKL